MAKINKMIKKIIPYIDKIIEYMLYLLVFFIPTSISGINIFSGLLFIIYVIRLVLKQDQTIWKGKFNKLILLFAVFSLFSVLWANDRYRALSFFISPVLKYVLIYYLIINYINTKTKFYKIFVAYWSSHIISGGYAIYRNFVVGIRRVDGFTHNPNRLGSIMMMFIIINFAILLYTNRKNLKIGVFSIIGIIVGTLALFASSSRGALLGLIAGLFIVALLKGKKFLIYLLIGLILLSLFMPSYYKNRISKLTDITSNNVYSRLSMYKAGFDMFKEKPILGIGLNNVRTVYDMYDLPEFEHFGNEHRNLHNLYINILVELGAIGFGILIYLIFVLGKKAWLNYKINKNWFTLGIIGLFVGEGTHNLFDYTFHASEVFMIVLVFIGLLMVNEEIDLKIKEGMISYEN